MDRTKKHLYRDALLHSNRFAHPHPDLDAHTEQYTAPHLHSLPDPDAASHNNSNTHAYFACHVDSLPYAYACNTESNMDSLADAYTASHADLYINTHGKRNTLISAAISHML